MSIRSKILFAFMGFIAFFLITYGIYSFNENKEFVETNVVRSIEQVQYQSASYIDYKLNYINRICDNLLADEEINTILRMDDDSHDLNERLGMLNDLKAELLLYRSDNDIENIIIYSYIDYLWGHESSNIRNFESSESEDWAQKRLASKEKYEWYVINDSDDLILKDNDIICVRKIKNLDKFSEDIGMLMLVLDYEEIENHLKRTLIYDNSATYILNNDGDILLKVGNSSNDYSDEVMDDIALINRNSDTIHTYEKQNNERFLVTKVPVENGQWQLISVMAYDELLKAETRNNMQLVFLLLGVAIAAVMVAYYLAIVITKPLKSITTEMKKVAKGNLDSSIEIRGNDEISYLIKNYNYMIEHINKLVQDKFEHGLEARQQDLVALQAQINPHFLYNTLDFVNWYAINNDVPEISDTVTSLAKFYKLSLNRGKHTIEIQDEINHIKEYINLQNIRLNNAVTAEYHIEDRLKSYKIIKLLLQPIVENAIEHGIRLKDNAKGNIAVSIWFKNCKLHLSVEDDGVGIPDDKIDNIGMDTKSSSYGIWNIRERLRLYYGEESKLVINSEVGKGTKVEIIIPYRIDDE